MSGITFLIGNGFDLACGIKSRYIDSYKSYIESDSKTDTISRFKKTIERDIDSWADFEMKMAEYARVFNDDTELTECIRDYSAFLNNYLLQEQKQFQNATKNDDNLLSAMVDEMGRSFCCFFDALTKNDRREILATMSDGRQYVYRFISFNYTKIFDELADAAFTLNSLSKYTKNNYSNQPVIHIHGELENDVVLGVDNASQLKDLPYKLSRRGSRNIIKPTFIKEYDDKRQSDAFSYIQSSNIICVFGLTLGESDLTWRKALAAWLLEHQRHHLIFYKHSLATKKYPVTGITQRMDDEEDYKEKLIEILFGKGLNNDSYLQIYKQIHIPTGSTIFNISNVSYTVTKGATIAEPPSMVFN